MQQVRTEKHLKQGFMAKPSLTQTEVGYYHCAYFLSHIVRKKMCIIEKKMD